MSEISREREQRIEGPRVLILEEPGLLREGLASLFRGAAPHYRVTVASPSVDQAEHLLDGGAPDVIISANSMAGRAALETARTIRLRCPQARLVVIGDSHFAGVVREALRAGATGYLTKEASFSELEDCVRRVLRGQSSFPPSIRDRLIVSGGAHRLDGDPDGSPLDLLTPRELEVLTHLAQGLSVKECASVMGRSTSTVDNHKSRIMKKLGIHRSVDLTRLAIREGLVSG